jgi:hypothetical protein
MHRCDSTVTGLNEVNSFEINLKMWMWTIEGNVIASVQVLRVCAVAQLAEALRYKPEGRGFDSRWCYWNFLLT